MCWCFAVVFVGVVIVNSVVVDLVLLTLMLFDLVVAFLGWLTVYCHFVFAFGICLYVCWLAAFWFDVGV